MVMVKAKFLMFIFSGSLVTIDRPHKNQARNGSSAPIVGPEWKAWQLRREDMMKQAAPRRLKPHDQPKKAAITRPNFFCPQMSMLLALPLLLYSNGKKGDHTVGI
ncbi:hypothetical protein LP421_27050 [Rhizobium sp. RCAM05350]|nr:hypothetical protein LP421_27050 [Rhizobium sp. RCAM05350]